VPFSTFNKAYIIENNIGTCDGDGSVGEGGGVFVYQTEIMYFSIATKK